MTFPRREISSIAISGQACSGKTTLATLLAKDMRWNHVNVGQIFRDLVRDSGLLVEDFGSLDDASLRQVDEEMQLRMKTTFHCVWEGRLTAWLAKSLPHVMTIYCYADDTTRANRCAKRESLSLEDALGQISKRDEEERLVFKRLYDISSVQKEASFDLTIDTSSNSPHGLLEQVKRHLNHDFDLG